MKHLRHHSLVFKAMRVSRVPALFGICTLMWLSQIRKRWNLPNLKCASVFLTPLNQPTTTIVRKDCFELNSV